MTDPKMAWPTICDYFSTYS